LPAPVRSARTALTQGLRQARRDAGLTGATLAARIGAGWGQPKVSKIESGRQFPTSDDVRAWARATEVPEARLLELHARALHEYHAFRDTYATQGGAVRQQEIYAAAETAASVIVGFQPVIMQDYSRPPTTPERCYRSPAAQQATAAHPTRSIASWQHGCAARPSSTSPAGAF
jgi:transcriptional regulator with XRE-family HTH domain